MFVILSFVLLLPLLIAIVRNGMQGKGYKVVLTLPPLDSKHGLLKRFGVVLYLVAGIAVAILSKYVTLSNEGYVGVKKIILVIGSFLGLGLVLYVYRKNKE